MAISGPSYSNPSLLWRWGLQGRRSIGWTLVVSGSVLFLLTLFGRFPPSSLAPITNIGVPTLPMISAPSSGAHCLVRYYHDPRLSERFGLREATAMVYRNTTHSVHRRVSPLENWLQWGLGHLYEPLSRTQDFDRLVRAGYGDCSERSQILKTLAERAGRACRFVGLNGHVVLEVYDHGHWRVADADYGAAYPFSVEELADNQHVGLIRERLRSQGHSSEAIERYLEIVQSSADNVRCAVGSPISPRLWYAELACSVLAWGIPMGLVVLGVRLLHQREGEAPPWHFIGPMVR